MPNPGSLLYLRVKKSQRNSRPLAEVLLLIPTHFTEGAGYTVNNAKMSSILLLSTLFHYSSTSFFCKSFSAGGGLKFSPNYPKLTVSSGCRNYYSSTGESQVMMYWDKCGRKLVLKVIEQIFRFESNPYPCFMPCLWWHFHLALAQSRWQPHC